MAVCKQYKYDHRGWLEAVEDTLSDREIDLTQFMPPVSRTFVEPPTYDPALQIPVWDGSAWAVHDLSEFEPTLEELKERRKAEMAKARYEAEISGIDFYGTRIATDDRSQSKIAGAAMKAMQDPAYTCWWKGESGWVQLDAPTIMAVADAVRAHVQACYDREMDLDIDIDMAETAEAVLAIAW